MQSQFSAVLNDQSVNERDATVGALKALAGSLSGRDKRLLAAVDSFEIFCEQVMTANDGSLLELRDFHRDVVHSMQNEKRLLIMLPRGHLKSTLMVAYACWVLGRKRDTRIIWISAVENTAIEFLEQIENVLRYNERYRQLFGNLIPDPSSGITWAKTQKTVAGRSHYATHSSMFAVGVSGNIIGRRADLIIADDIVSTQNSRTEFLRNQLWNWYWSVPVPILEPTGQIIVAGTRYYPDDFYAKLSNSWGSVV